jgi:hypothetical protein
LSNFLAVATTTAALRQLLDTAVKADVAGATATSVRPDAGNGAQLPDRGVNVFLYQVTPNAAYRNEDLPTRDRSGQAVQKPTVALDLHYLLSFYGSDQDLEPQRCLGSVARTLHAQPTISRRTIREVIDSAVAGNPQHFLAGSDLADQVEMVKLTPQSLSLDELSRLWSVFYQTGYALSMTYLASLVLIESEERPRQALPVRERLIGVLPIRQPSIERVEPQLVEFAAGVRIAIVGRDLFPEESRVLFGDREGVVVADESSPHRIVVELPAEVRAGVRTVRVVQSAPLDPPRRTFQSNLGVFALQPRVSSITFLGGGGDPRIRVNVQPEVGLEQGATLYLTQFDTPPPENPVALSLEARPRAGAGDPLIFGAADVPAATYLARLELDGATSGLVVDENPASPTFGRFVGPTVTVP